MIDTELCSPPAEAGRPLSELASDITAGAVRLAAATAAWLHVIAEFDERGGWHGVGIRSCAHWLAWQCGLGPGAAREHVRVARALRRLPLVDRAFTDGRLSYAKVRALTRVAEPSSEADLLEVAEELTASQLERVVRQWRRADRPDAETIRLKRDFDSWWDDDGMLVLRVRMPAEQGAALLTAVNSLAERTARRERALRTKTGRPTGADVRTDEDEDLRLGRERTTARRLAALAQLADAAVDADRRAGDPPRREVVVHVDQALLDDDAAAGRAYLDGGPALHPAQARRMLCEATVVTMLEKDREVLAVGRKKRRATRAQRRALLRRDGGCVHPACPENRIERLNAHHLRHWLYGGRTDLANLVLLCDVHHGLVHDLDLLMSRRGRQLIVTTQDGRRVWGAADAAFAEALDGVNARPTVPAGPTESTEGRVMGVHPVDSTAGRRPPGRRQPGRRQPGPPAVGRPQVTRPAGHRPGSRSRPVSRRPNRRTDTGGLVRRRATVPARTVASALYPDGEPPLPEAMHVNGERIDLAYVVGVLMGNRDLARRMAQESGAQLTG